VSDLPAPSQSLRTALSLHALVAAAIMIVVAVSGGGLARAFGIAALYFALAGGWSWLRIRRAARRARASAEGERRR
jgi:small neutral amino acid transporter SnatA (MarC family)